MTNPRRLGRGLEALLGRPLGGANPDTSHEQPGGPGAAELLDWTPVLERAGVHVEPERVAQAYLELAVLVRALEGLTTAALVDAMPDRSSLWAGLFDLRENLFGRALDDLRALAVA